MAGEIADAAHTALSYWEELGAALVEISLPDMSLARSAALTIQLPEALSYHRPILAKSDHLYGDVARPLLVAGQFFAGNLQPHLVGIHRIELLCHVSLEGQSHNQVTEQGGFVFKFQGFGLHLCPVVCKNGLGELQVEVV